MNQKIDYSKLKVPFLDFSFIHNKADEIRTNNYRNKIPIEADLISEKLGFEIIPVPYLYRNIHNDAFLAEKEKSIFIDSERYFETSYWFRSNFSIAHELGHFYLHQNFASFESISDYLSFHKMIPEQTSKRLEMQANEFAGRLLVPPQFLKTEIYNVLTSNYDEDNSFSDLSDKIDYISAKIQSKFEVSKDVIKIRIEKEKIEIP